MNAFHRICFHSILFLFTAPVFGQLPQSPDWTKEGEQNTQLFGDRIEMKGDYNADGYQDLVVGAPKTDSGQTNNGKAYLYLGSDTGLVDTAAWTFTCDSGDAFFGGSLSYAGDVDNDGYDDLIVGAPRMDSNLTDRGRVYLFRGHSSGLEDTASWTYYGADAGGEFGISVSTAGDVNDDGFDDVIIGAHHEDSMATDAGRAYLFRGSSNGLEDTASWIEGVNESNAEFGGSVSQAGDVNGDGYGDVVVGCPKKGNGSDNFGRVYFYYGSPNGLPDTSSYWITPGVFPDAQVGRTVSEAGDIDKDGYDDVVFGTDAPGAGPSYASGEAWALHGSASGIQYTGSFDWEFGPSNSYMRFADDLANAGDINGDGYPDLIAGAPEHSSDKGKLYLFPGSDTGYADQPTSTYEGPQILSYLGTAVSAGDVDGDGYPDIGAGANRFNGTYTDGGKVFVFMGSCANKSPHFSASPSTPCVGDSVQLAADSGYNSYAWSTGDSGMTVGIELTDTSVYSVQTVGDSGCVTQNDTTLTPAPLPDPQFTGLESSYCLKDTSYQLTGSPSGGSFSGPGVSGGGSFDPQAAGMGSHTVTYSYTDSNGCSGSSDTTLEVTDCTTSLSFYEQEEELSIRPNPTEGALIFDHPGPREWEVTIRDLQGQALKRFRLSGRSSRTRKDVEGLPEGLYFLHFQGEKEEKEVRRLILR